MKIDENIAEIRKYVEKNFGPKCKDYAPLCASCEVYRALEALEWLIKDNND